ncbi:MAG: peptidoglycan-binding protein [Pseudodesulfovibrio sp.]
MKCIFIAISLWLLLASPALADYQYGLDAFNKGEYEVAYTRWRKAAMTGDKRAQYHLAGLYQEGLGAPKSPKLAYIWFAIAAQSGGEEAREAEKARNDMKRILTSVDLAEADLMLQEYIKAQTPLSARTAQRPTLKKPVLSQPKTPLPLPGKDTDADHVREVQEMLARLGYRPGAPDGKPGRRTIQAIKVFQKRNGLPSNGKISAQLHATLKQVVPPATAKTLFEAARTGNPTAVIAILRQGIDINSHDADGLTALHYACANSHPMTAGILLDAGADINAQTQSGDSPLALAYPTNNRELIQLLKNQ